MTSGRRKKNGKVSPGATQTDLHRHGLLHICVRTHKNTLKKKKEAKQWLLLHLWNTDDLKLNETDLRVRLLP